MQPLPRPIRAVIIDLDGTLLDTETIYRAAFFATLAGLDFDMAEAQYDLMIGLPSPERRRLLLELFGSGFPADRFFSDYYRQRSMMVSGGLALKPGVNVLMNAIAAAGLPKGIATSASRQTALSHLTQSGLGAWPDVIVTRDDVAAGKPAPDSYIRAAAELGCAPSDCLVVEDSPHGVAAALSAGAMTVMVPDWVAPTPALEGRCAAVLPSLHEVAALLGRSVFQADETEATYVRSRTREAVST